MGIIAWLVVGALAGWIASKIMGRDAQMGAVANIIVGIIGAFIGGWVTNLLGISTGVDGINISSILIAILGAVILLFIVGLVQKRR